MSRDTPKGFIRYMDRENQFIREEDSGESNPLVFDTTEKFPTLPLKNSGKIWHTGWDIPTIYAIDSANQCWMDNAHGHSLEPRSAHVLISQSEDDSFRNSVRKILGMKPQLPSWMREALRRGWTPPDTFDRSEYE